MSDLELSLLARLVALEYMVIDLYSSVYEQGGLSPEQIETRHTTIRSVISSHTVPEIDASLSDAFVQEIEEEVARVLEAVAEARRR